jgi:DNA-binding NarL/FixJ family response regulator
VSSHSYKPPARVLVADYGLVRLGVRMALQDEDGIEICAQAGDADEAIAEARRSQPDVCLVGWDLPGGGITAIHGMFEVAPIAAVVVLASTQDVDDLLAALRAGAIGYVPGGASCQSLRRVVRAVLSHEAAVPRSMVRDLILELRATTLGTHDVTRREAQVLDMLRQGHSTSEIALRLRISPVTVRRHISDVMHKLGAEDRSALMHAGSERPAPRTKI